MNAEPNPAPDHGLWRELEAMGEQDEKDEHGAEPRQCERVPQGFRWFTPSGIAHDYMREDVHNKLVEDEFQRGISLGREQERATHGHDLIFAVLAGAFAGFLLAALATATLMK